MRFLCRWLFRSMAWLAPILPVLASNPGTIQMDPGQNLVTLADGRRDLILRLNFHGRCVLDQVIVRGRQVVGDSAVVTGVRLNGQWFATRNIATPDVSAKNETVTVTGIRFGPAGGEIHETWKFTVEPDRIVWRIARKYSTDALLDDAAFPEWDFKSMSTWTGGILDDGGVVLNKYLDAPNATYGAHFGTVTFWNSQSNDALRITPLVSANQFGAGRFSHQGDGVFTFNYVISGKELKPRHDLKRFLENQQDLWAPFRVTPSEVSVTFTLKALNYSNAYNRGTFVGVDGNEVRDLLNTVARYGVIDERLTGGNGWRSGYICLHEPFFAEIGLALDESDYTANFSQCLDYERDHAVGADGRVKSRWCYTAGDAMPGAYDSFGFYEARWGWLLDSQPDYVVNVAEQFNLTGDRRWLAGQKTTCEKALNFLIRREVGNNGLVAMMDDSIKQHKSSDWIDVIWASYENAFVNAQLYYALELWATDEDALNNPANAANYRAFAARLKASFNRSVAEGGFWNPTNQWYVYWRDQDGSIHGDNLVTPVNFAAIACGLCDDPARRTAILNRIEHEMQKERLFSWPLNFFPYQRDEGGAGNFPFPNYENGDIFLSWDEFGIRAYAANDPAVALKYIRNILARYGEDGLSFQRYLRRSQRGAGDDILAGNCMAIVGLYRDIYGIQPKPNRLYLEPHLTADLNGTKICYQLRGRLYLLDLSTGGYAIAVGTCTLCDSRPFSVNATARGLEYFPGTNTDWAMAVSPLNGQPLSVRIDSWPDSPSAPRRWSETAQRVGGRMLHEIVHLEPGTIYQLKINGQITASLRADKAGRIHFTNAIEAAQRQQIEIAPAAGKQ